ncbi:putative polyketide synthase [Bombardia bombarda]|uniref:Polyketide synthase n=1 Tax=Bombardia bombarda TaxID=252184 RepID=A0AA39WV53_9PEZI|nr:putative polyketide synthase [Bombardia bombarda]
MACHLPGHISSPQDLHNFLSSNKTAQGTVPDDRYNIKGFYDKNNGRAGVMNVDGGYFLQSDVRQFDNGFFGINNLEASYMDPQQRKLLEVVYECFENAGVSMEDISGSNTAVYVGNFTVDYQSMQSRDPDYLHRYAATGGGTSIMSNRISHVFNLTGPSLTLDTACSSSVYALHHAVNAIKNGDCDGAIVAGANLITSPEQHLGTAKGGFLSPTSTCHTFDTSADGYARAEGINAIYIKRVSSAMKQDNPIRAIIRGTAINANGKTPGITLPSARMQEVVVRKAYEIAGLDFDGTDYIECHGTGTAVGDPIEVEGLANCFKPRTGSAPLMIGSVKTNLGHSEAASGLTSIIKVTLAFEHGLIPPSYGVKNLNPKLKLEDRNMQVITENKPWPRALKRASINSFGYGGANGHIILESPESFLEELAASQTPSGSNSSAASAHGGPEQVLVLPFSAGSDQSLEKRRQHVTSLIEQSDSEGLWRLAASLAKRDAKLRLRDSILATTGKKPVLLEGTQGGDAVLPGAQPLPLAFVFTGQGAQYAGMGKELLEQDSAFLATIRELDAVLQALPAEYAPAWTLEQTILDPADTSKVNNVERSQPLCTAVQIALVDMLRSWGVTPTATVGHSSGEIAASYSAGLLTAKQAIVAAYFRGFVVGNLKSRGAMMAAGISADVASALIKDLGLNEVRVACVNAPESVTISGAESGVLALQANLQGENKFARKLETGGRAYHSHMMAEVGDEYEKLCEPYLGGKAALTTPLTADMFSSVGHSSEGLTTVSTGTNMAAYFRRNLEQPVQFSAAVSNILKSKSGKFHLVEIGPHAALKGPVQQIRTLAKRDKESAPYSPTLVRKEDANLSMKRLASTLFAHGHSINWLDVNNLREAHHVLAAATDLPPYPWDYSKELPWHEPRASVDIRNRKHIRHELLGTKTAAGNGIDWAWRNLPRLSEMPWLADHKLETQVVLPGSAYFALAIEAISQILGLKKSLQAGEPISFEVQNVSISAPFLVPDDNDPIAEHTELHTNMSQRKLSTGTTSSEWYDFTVSSWQQGTTTSHCTGSIRVTNAVEAKDTGVLIDTEGYEAWGMKRWYDKSREEGLNFGPHFQSLTSLHTDGSRESADALATTQLDPPSSKTAGIFYAVHPITLDACFQAAIMGGTAGNINTLRAFVPVFIAECRINLPTGGAASITEDCKVHSHMEKTGFSTRKVDCTLRTPSGDTAIDIKGLRMTLYTGKAPVAQSSSLYLQRQPCLRITWKPDILRVRPGAETVLREYITKFAAEQSADMRDRESVPVFGALLDLAGHKMPRMRVLEVGEDCACTSKQCLELLGYETAFPRCRTWNKGSLNEEGEFVVEGVEEKNAAELFDVVVIPSHKSSQSIWTKAPQQLVALISDRGVVITRKTKDAVASLTAAGFITLELPSETLLGVRDHQAKDIKGKAVLIVKPNKSSFTIDALATVLSAHLKRDGIAYSNTMTLSETDDVEVTAETVVISLLELEHEFLATVSSDDMNRLRKITNVVTSLTWLNGGNMLGAPNPDLTLTNGLSRALMLEQPSLRFTVLDVGSASLSANSISALYTVSENVTRTLATHCTTDDTEFIQLNSLLYVSRFAPDMAINTLFRQRLEPQSETLQSATLASVSPAKLSIGQVGVTDTMHFQQVVEPKTTPAAGFVDVDLRAVSLNAKDIYAMSGRVETKASTLALDFAGIISAVGPGVTNVKVGDRVAGLAPNHFGTTERVPAACVHTLRDGEEFTVIPTLLTVYSTALFSLRDRASLRKGESVLIHAGAGAFGLAAIAMAQRMGATVYTTVGSQSKRDYLVKEAGVPAENIFNSRDATFVEGIKAATGGRGVDVVVNSLVGDLMHATWDCIAPFGRFVEIGKKELIDAGRLGMQQFLKSATFTAFDLSDFFYAEDPYYREVFYGLIAESLALYREGAIKAPPIATFDVSNIAQAYRYFNNKDRIGKVVISMEDQQTIVPYAPAQYNAVFSANKSYLLVGCLGGLGRSLSRWMMARGARKFVFLGRSGCDKPSAASLVARLQNAGATVTVVRGDVSSASEVAEAVAASAALGPIGGVVQAAMGLREALFTVMENSAWHTGIQPKWRGTWNLHNALEGHDSALEFFLMTSSLSGSCGTATESNYCAANGFLDAFAHWRRAQGKPAIALGLGMISEVGYLHENPEIEAMLLRKGIQPLNEEEFLQVLDYGLAGPGGDMTSENPSVESAHILTGLEVEAIRKLMAAGFDVNNGIMEDPRTSLLAASLLAERDALDAASDGTGAGAQLDAAAEWVKDVPAAALPMLAAEASAPTMLDAILRMAKKRFSNLILMPADQVDERRPLPSFGVDSMLAAEFRTWFWNAFKVDVPYLDIVSPQKALHSLAEFVEEKMVASWAA